MSPGGKRLDCQRWNPCAEPDQGACCRCRYKAPVPAITATAVRAVIVPSTALAGCGCAGATPAHGCCGENASAQHVLPGSATRFCLKRNTRSRSKALLGSGLAIRAVRPAQKSRTDCRAGATPPKTALACTAGPFGEVAPGIFPCRKANRANVARIASGRHWTPRNRQAWSEPPRTHPTPYTASRLM